MLLIDSIKKSFGCVIENPSITLFVVLFLIASNMLASYIVVAHIPIIKQILILSLFALIFIFFSGWLKVIKETTDREKIKEKNYYALFLEGIGENIVSVSIGIIIYFVVIMIAILLAQLIALNIFGDINFFLDEISKMPMENASFAQYFNGLTVNQKYIIYGWNLCIMASVGVFNFLSLYYFPAILYSDKKLLLRPVVSIWTSIKFLFKNFFQSIGLNIFVFILCTILAFLNAQFGSNKILSIIFLLIHIYLTSYIVMLIFNYYEAKNSRSDRADSVGENEVVNSVSESD